MAVKHKRKPRKKHQARATKHHHAATPAKSHAAIIAEEARRYHVPAWVLWGVYGIETSFGGNVAVSSAGAEGAFQFEPATAAEYGVDTSNFRSSANGAARYLRDLHKTYGSWNVALEHYSGGGYGVAQVKETAETKNVDLETPLGTVPFPGPNLNFNSPFGPLSPLNHLPDIGPSIPGIPGAGSEHSGDGKGGFGELFEVPGELLQAANATTSFLTMLTSVDFWIRAGLALGAFILIYIGLHSLTGAGPGSAEVAQAAQDGATALATKGA